MSKMKELFELKQNGKCPFCGKDMENAEFRDENALKEKNIVTRHVKNVTKIIVSNTMYL